MSAAKNVRDTNVILIPRSISMHFCLNSEKFTISFVFLAYFLSEFGTSFFKYKKGFLDKVQRFFKFDIWRPNFDRFTVINLGNVQHTGHFNGIIELESDHKNGVNFASILTHQHGDAHQLMGCATMSKVPNEVFVF